MREGLGGGNDLNWDMVTGLLIHRVKVGRHTKPTYIFSIQPLSLTESRSPLFLLIYFFELHIKFCSSDPFKKLPTHRRPCTCTIILLNPNPIKSYRYSEYLVFSSVSTLLYIHVRNGMERENLKPRVPFWVGWGGGRVYMWRKSDKLRMHVFVYVHLII